MQTFTEIEKKLIKELINAYQPDKTVKIGDILLQFHKIQCFKKNDYPSVIVQYYEYQDIDFENAINESLKLIDLLYKNKDIDLNPIFDSNTIGEEWKMLPPIDKNGNGKIVTTSLPNDFSVDTWTLLSSSYVVENSLSDFTK